MCMVSSIHPNVYEKLNCDPVITLISQTSLGIDRSKQPFSCVNEFDHTRAVIMSIEFLENILGYTDSEIQNIC